MGVVQGGKPSRKVLIGFAVIMVMLCLISGRALTGNSAAPLSPRTNSTASSSSSGKPQSVATLSNPSDNTVATLSLPNTGSSAPPQPQTLLDLSGNGSAQTRAFTTNGNWTVTYTYDCTSAGGTGNFQFDVADTDGTLNGDTGANELAASGGNTDYYYDAGEHYLKINSECNWHVSVRG